jgi:hypothetical protein
LKSWRLLSRSIIFPTPPPLRNPEIPYCVQRNPSLSEPDVRTTVNVKTAILWYVTPCILVSIDILKYTVSHSRRQQSPNRHWTISWVNESGHVAGYSETSIYTYQTTRCSIPTKQAMYV